MPAGLGEQMLFRSTLHHLLVGFVVLVGIWTGPIPHFPYPEVKSSRLKRCEHGMLYLWNAVFPVVIHLELETLKGVLMAWWTGALRLLPSIMDVFRPWLELRVIQVMKNASFLLAECLSLNEIWRWCLELPEWSHALRHHVGSVCVVPTLHKDTIIFRKVQLIWLAANTCLPHYVSKLINLLPKRLLTGVWLSGWAVISVVSHVGVVLFREGKQRLVMETVYVMHRVCVESWYKHVLTWANLIYIRSFSY